MIKIQQITTIVLLLSYFFLPNLNAQNRPNILVIIADDMGVDAMSGYDVGSSQPNTPNLDALMSEGIMFNNAWAAPMCSPTRASILTGRHGNKNGIMTAAGANLALDEVTLFEQIDALTGGAYANAVLGKWHIGGNNANHPNEQGVEHFAGVLGSGVGDYFKWARTENGTTDTSETYITTQITAETIDWIGNQTQPWIAWVAHTAPHSPIHLPPDSLYTRTQTNGNRNKFLCMIEAVDHEVGRLYSSLTQAQKDSTIIIFVGDNGTPNTILRGYPDGHGKSTLYEGGIRVPMFVTGYGVNRVNEEEDGMVNLLDIFATIYELLGYDLPGGVENSFSFKDLLTDANAPTRPYNFSELDNGSYDGIAIRNEQYKLIRVVDSLPEFFDLIVDPLEFNDLMLIGLTAEQQAIYDELNAEADVIVESWSCNDAIQNGEEEGIDCGSSTCVPCMVSVNGFPSETEIAIFPNPSKEFIQLDGLEFGNTIQIFSVTGVLLKTLESLEGLTRIEVGDLGNGVYFLSVLNENMRQQYHGKFVKTE